MSFEALFVSEGGMIDYMPGADVAAGEVVVVGHRCYIAKTAIKANALGALGTYGIFDVLKTANLVVTAGDAIFWNDTTNKATKTPSDVLLGAAVKDAAAGDATVRVFLAASEDVLASQAEGTPGSPLVVRKICTVAAPGDVTVVSSFARKVRVLDAWLIARDANAANVKLHQGTAGTDDITDAVAKGTTDSAIVRFTKVIAAKAEVAAGGSLKANLSAAGSAEVCALLVPVP